MSHLTRRRARLFLPLIVAVVAATGLLAAPTSTLDVRAATPDLTIVSDARYVVQPDDRRVRVTLKLTLTNHLQDTTTRRYYFDRAYLAVMPSASRYRLTSDGGGSPGVGVNRRTKDYTVLRLDLGKRLYGGKTASYTLRFDIVDKGGKATRDIRIGDSLVSFPVWAFASDSTPGSSVTVVVPKGFKVDVAAGEIPAPSTDSKGRTIFRSGRLAKPLSFFAFLMGDRPGAYDETTITPVVAGKPVELTIRSWPEDAAWRKRVGRLVDRALPVLGEAIGLPWPRADALVVQEAVSRSTGGYAGLFDPSRGLVEIAYYANDFVVLHESAHGWFNGTLLADRWANEAFASYYGLAAAKTLKVKATGDEMTPNLESARIPLNAWGAVGREKTETEDYAYAATLALARAIAERAGKDGLRRVWADAADRAGAYQPPDNVGVPTGPERVDGPPDWRGLLDLLEARTAGEYDDLWRTWVARDTDLVLLDARRAARERYDVIIATAGDWELPKPVRDAMRAWRFDDATVMLDEAAQVLGQRAQVEVAAAAADLTPPGALQTAFEGDDGFADATAEATAELETIARYDDAVASRPASVDPILSLGLIDETPELDLVAAREAFERGDLSASAAAADAAAATWSGAAELGRGRLLSLTILAIAVLLAIVLVFAWSRTRRRRRYRMQAHPIKH